MKVAFFTEMNFKGKISRSFKNMRTEFAWMCKLDADHYNLKDTLFCFFTGVKLCRLLFNTTK